MKKRKRHYWVFLVTTVLFTLAAASTLIPSPAAGRACFFGYYAHCSFTPISTVLCLLGSAVSCIVRRRVFTEPAA